MAKHLGSRRRGLSGIWTGVLVIIILLLFSSFLVVTIDKMNTFTKNTATYLSKNAEVVSVAKAINGTWYYDTNTSQLLIFIQNWYQEPVLITTIGIIIKNNINNIDHIIIDKYNSNQYNITMPLILVPGDYKLIGINITNDPIIVTLGIIKGGTVTIALPKTNTPLSLPIKEAKLIKISDNTIYYTDFSDSSSIDNWIFSDSRRYWYWSNVGYWDNDGALNSTLPGWATTYAVYNYDLSQFSNLYIETKLSSTVFGQTIFVNFGIILDYTDIQIYILVTIDGYYLNIYVIDYNGWPVDWTSTTLDEQLDPAEWYSIVVQVNTTHVFAEVFNASNPRLGLVTLPIQPLASLSYKLNGLLVGEMPTYSGVVSILWSDTPAITGYDEFIISTSNPVYVTIRNSVPGTTLELQYNSVVINRSIVQSSSTLMEIPSDPVTGVEGNANLLIIQNTRTILVSTTDPILGGETYKLVLITS